MPAWALNSKPSRPWSSAAPAWPADAGSIGTSALGAMVMAVLGAGLAQMGVQEPTRRLTTGAVIVAAAAADVWRRRRT